MINIVVLKPNMEIDPGLDRDHGPGWHGPNQHEDKSGYYHYFKTQFGVNLEQSWGHR